MLIDMESGVPSIGTAEVALRNGDSEGILGPVTVAAGISRCPFLLAVGVEWGDSNGRKLERKLVGTLCRLSEILLWVPEPVLAVEIALEGLNFDPFWESSRQLFMQSCVTNGSPSEWVMCYHRLREFLLEELARYPSGDGEILYAELLG